MRAEQFIGEIRIDAKRIADAVHDLIEKQPEWNAKDYGNTLGTVNIGGDNFTAANIGPAIFDAAIALNAVLNSAAGANLLKIL